MRRSAIIAALTALAAAAVAFAAKPPDSVTAPNAVYARRGSLGADDYVATNVAPCKSAYQLVRVTDGRLRDRAVNAVTVTNDVTLALPGRRTVAGYARSLCASISVESQGPCRVTLDGAAKVYVTDAAGGGLVLERGRHLMQVLEIGDGEYVVDLIEITEMEGE